MFTYHFLILLKVFFVHHVGIVFILVLELFENRFEITDLCNCTRRQHGNMVSDVFKIFMIFS